MGLYINPSAGSKEAWLERNGKEVDYNNPPKWNEIENGYYPVIIADNGLFTAAAIAFDEGEYRVFLTPDTRPKQLWIVHEKLLYTVTRGDLNNYVDKPYIP